MKEWMAKFKKKPPLFVDSGGFSAATLGIHVEMRDYVRWLNRYSDEISMYANFDVIGDAEKTWINHLKMQVNKKRPIPVIHYPTDVDYIRRYYEKGYTYMALGGLVPHMKVLGAILRGGKEADHPVFQWLTEAHQMAKSLGVSLHGFGVTNWGLLKAFSWTSVDSSSWSSGYRFGQVNVFDGQGKWQNFSMRDVSSIMHAAKSIRQLGCSPAHFAQDRENLVQSTIEVSARSWESATRWLVEQRKKRGDNTPLTVYLVDACEPHLIAGLNSLERT